jgi:LAS superfamily LD-carboxypeptidase LdcB
MSTYLETAIEQAMGIEAPPLAGVLELGDGSPFVRRAVDDCWARLQQFVAHPSATATPGSGSLSRIRTETGVSVDANPYAGITRGELEAVIRAAFTSHQPPEVLLALWAKEGSTRSVDTPRTVAQASTEANARTLFRSSVFFVDLGIDHFVVVTAVPGQDNRFDSSDASAAGHEAHFARQVAALVTEGLLREDITAAINRELHVSRLANGRFAVLPTTKFYALSLLLVDALFTRHLRAAQTDIPGAPPALAYMHWNMRESSWRQFVTSADRHRREPQFAVGGQPITSERWALHTAPRENEFGQARRNAIRVQHYLDSYRPIFAPSMTLITPGIEDLRQSPPGTRAAEAVAGALQQAIDPYRSDPTGDRPKDGPQRGAVALMRELQNRYGGRGEIYNPRTVRGSTRLSLHAEGRAVDWYRSARDPAEAAEAQRILDWLLATDADGNEHALARRMGVQEIIWNRRIWTARRHAEGWRAYTGQSPHTDHIHIGLNWAGARMETSHWRPQTGVQQAPAFAAQTPPAAAPRLGSAADIDAYFRRRTGSSFLDWFHTTQAGRGSWAGKDVQLDADTRRRFVEVWNGIPEMFETATISVEQFVALQSIFINELGGGMAPLTERMGRTGHPGMSYLFDRIPEIPKASYNKAPNKTAFDCFNDEAFIGAHGRLALGDRLAHTTNRAWAGQAYPAGVPTDVTAAAFVAEADFCKFRGRGLIQTTWRPAYRNIVTFVQSYLGANAKVNEYKTRWAGQDPDRVCTTSANADWDDLFQHTGYVIPWAGIRLHNHGRYLGIAADEATRLGTERGSFAFMGTAISGSRTYGDLFRRRCVQILDGLRAAGGSGSLAVAAGGPTVATGPPPSSSLTWQGATAEQLAFMRRVYDKHVERSAGRGSFVAEVPSSELGAIEGGMRARTAAADACRTLLQQARAALSAAQGAGDARARGVERISVVSAYRSVAQQFSAWQSNFPRYYEQTRAQRQAAAGGEHGVDAVSLTVQHVGRVLGAPGFSLHNNGLAIDFGTREGARDLGANTSQRTPWRASWLFGWLSAHANALGFFQNTSIDEPWHWEYHAPAASGQALEAVVYAQGITAGEHAVAVVPLLARHHDAASADLFVRWNAIADPALGVDVVVHLHGYSSNQHLNLQTVKLPISGLDFTPPATPHVDGARAHPAWTGRARPTLLVLPRGRKSPASSAAYDFPALIASGGFAQLVDVALQELQTQAGLSQRIPVRRVILTAHSGGGSALNRILDDVARTSYDPHEVHVFDALYGNSSGVRAWVDRRLRADIARLQAGVPDVGAYLASDGGALRIFWTDGTATATTKPNSEAIQAHVRSLIPASAPWTSQLRTHYQVERSRVGHGVIAYWYGGRLLADAAAAIGGP